jgi:hypothetical protein
LGIQTADDLVIFYRNEPLSFAFEDEKETVTMVWLALITL